MSDVHNKTTRSYNMSQIRSKNTKPEMIVRKFLHSKGFRYKLHDINLPGKPDIVLPKYKTVVFVNGCFWHGHQGCKRANIPKSNIDYWKNKIENNRKRDEKNINLLKSGAWKVYVLWECEINEKTIEKLLESKLGEVINSR